MKTWNNRNVQQKNQGDVSELNVSDVEILIPEKEIKQRVSVLGEQITKDYPDGDLVVVGVLKGAFVFMADLIRSIHRSMDLDFLEVSSYGNSSVSSGQVHIMKDLKHSIEGKHLLLVEDILDTGNTLNHVVHIMQQRHPASIKICCLLDKPARRTAPIRCDYRGYQIPDEFVVGYGLDYAERYRNYPDICRVLPAAVERISRELKQKNQ